MPVRARLPYVDKFEIDIVRALTGQLITKFEKLKVGALSQENIRSIKGRQGVYLLFQGKALVYVGKAKSLRVRIGKHLRKLEGRRNIDVRKMGFKCLYIHRNWTALAPESSLIRHYRRHRQDAAWNGNGFGPNDPGRRRETTQKRPDGFDMTYPIRDDWSCDFIESGNWNVYELLLALKKGLPYLLRFQKKDSAKGKTAKLKTVNRAAKGKAHPDLVNASVEVPRAGMPARELLKIIADALPKWQATVLPSHMILYREKRKYEYGDVL